MLRVLGSALIVLASGWCGLRPVLRLRRQLRTLEALEGMLSLLRAELSSRMTPLPELFRRLADSVQAPADALCASLASQMQAHPLAAPLQLMRQALPPMELEPRESAALLELANALGCYDLESQQRMVDLAQLRLRQAADRSRRRIAAEGRSWGALGICTGLALAIVLV